MKPILLLLICLSILPARGMSQKAKQIIQFKKTIVSQKTEDDHSYGKGTKSTTIEKEERFVDGVVDPDYQFTSTIEEYKDSKGTVIKDVVTRLNEKTLEKYIHAREFDQNKILKKAFLENRDASDHLTFKEDYIFDEKGKIDKQVVTYLDKDGKEHVSVHIFKDGKEDKSKHTLDGKLDSEIPKTKEPEKPKEDAQPKWGKWPDVSKDLDELIKEMEEENQKEFEKNQKEQQKNKKPEQEGGKNKISLGPGLIHYSDEYAHYNSFGPIVTFTHLVSSNIGVTLDAGIYWHKEKGKDAYQTWTQSYDQCVITAGVTWWPFPVTTSPFSTSVNGLLGIGELKVKVSTDGYGSSTNSYSSFALNIGAEEDYRINQRFGCGVQLAYTPTFFNKMTQNNYRVGILARCFLP